MYHTDFPLEARGHTLSPLTIYNALIPYPDDTLLDNPFSTRCVYVIIDNEYGQFGDTKKSIAIYSVCLTGRSPKTIG